MANHALAGVLFGLMIVPFERHVDHLRHHPTDRDRHMGHADADRRGRDAASDPLRDRRAARLARRVRAGKNWLRVFFVGDTDEGAPVERERDEFDRSPVAVVRDMIGGGVSLPWNLALSGLIGLSLLFTRLTFGSTGAMANADHVVGFLVLTTLSIAAAEVTRPVRYLDVLFGIALLMTPFAYPAGTAATMNSVVCGIALILLSRRRGPIRQRYGSWTRLIV
jgi:hypothetical protein